MMSAQIECPICGNQLSSVLSFELHLQSSIDGSHRETIDFGRCDPCRLGLQRRRGEDKFWWKPKCGVCNSQMVVIPVQTEPSLSIGQPEVLFSIDPIYYRAYDIRSNWFFDVSDDGEKFLMAAERKANSEIVVVQNWLNEVERLVPTR